MMKQTLAIEKNNDMITISRTEYEALKEQNAELFQQVEWLMEQIRLAKHKRFGASSEKSNEQLTLFNEAEVISDSSVTEPDLEEVRKHYRRKARVSKDRLPPNLPVEIVEHFLPEEKHHALNVVKPFMLWVKRSAGNSS